MRRRGGDHVHQLGLVGGGHHDHTRQVRHEGNVKRAGMGGTIGPDQPCPVDGEAHRQALDRNVVDDLIVAALKKGGIDRAERLHAPRGKSRRERDAMLFGYAHVEAAVRVLLCEQVQPRSIGHGRRHGDDLVVAAGLVDEGIGENLGIGRRVRGRLLLLARHHIEGGGRVTLVARRLGRSVSLALLGDHVDQHGPGRPRLDRAQDRQKLVQVMARRWDPDS